MLTPQEKTALLYMAQGKDLEGVRREMGLSSKTFNKLKWELFQKLGVTDRAAAVARASILGLFTTVERLKIVITPLGDQILEKVTQGWRDAEIERHLHCSNRDIVECIRRALDICKLPSRAVLVHFLRREGYLAA